MATTKSDSKKGKKQFKKEAPSLVHEEGFMHLTSDTSLYARSLKSVKEYLVKKYGIPLVILEGKVDEPSGGDYADWLLDNYPDTLVPPLVPDVININLPDNIEEEIEAMAEGIDENDPDAVEEMVAAQAAVANAARQRIWEELTSLRNKAINKNELLKIERKALMETFVETKPFPSIKYFLVHTWPQTSAITLKIEQHPSYKPGTHPQASTIAQILEITASLYSDTEVDKPLRIRNATKELEKLTMRKPTGYDAYLRLFNERLEIVRNEGGDIADSVLIEQFRDGLHDVPFKMQKERHADRIQRASFSTSFSGFVQQMTNFYQDWEKTKKSDSKDDAVVLSVKQSKKKNDGKHNPTATSGSSSGVTSSTSVSTSTEKSSVPDNKAGVSEKKEKCPYCERDHGGLCFDTKAIEEFFKRKMEAEIAASVKAKEKFNEKKNKQHVSIVKLTPKLPTVLVCQDNGEPCDCHLPQSLDIDKVYNPTDADLLPTLFCDSVSNEANKRVLSIEVPKGCVRFISDNGAECNLVTEVGAKALGAFDRHEEPMELIGVANFETNEVVSLAHDLGQAHLHPTMNVLSDDEMHKNYNELREGVNGPYPHRLVWTHKQNGNKFIFIRDPEMYGNVLWNLDVKVKSGKPIVANFYHPARIRNREPTVEEEKLISDAKFDHHRLGHPADDIFENQIATLPGITATVRGLHLWREIEGKCLGCIADKPRHAKLPSTKPVVCQPGEVIAGDIMFIDSESNKKPTLLLVDVGSKCPFVKAINGRTLGDLKEALASLMVQWTAAGNKPKSLLFDRESAILAAKTWMESTYNMILKSTAAGQKQPIAEVNIRTIKSNARRLKAGIMARFNYVFPFSNSLYKHAAMIIRSTCKRGEEKPPIEHFTGRKVDYVRDFRCELGEPIYVEKPKAGTYTGADEKTELGIYLGCEADTGVLEVYLLKTRRRVHRIAFERAEVPAWARDVLNNLKYHDEEPELLVESSNDEPNLITDNSESAPVITEAVQTSAERLENAMNRYRERWGISERSGNSDSDVAVQENGATPVSEFESDTESEESNSVVESNLPTAMPESRTQSSPEAIQPVTARSGYNLRDRRERRNYAEMVAHYSVKESVPKPLLCALAEGDDNEIEDILKVMQITYQKALKSEQSNSAREAMVKEIRQALQFKSFHGKHLSDLSEEERRLILKSTSLFREKYLPTGEFEKYKARFLVRGDMQKEEHTAATSSPVVRHETVMWFLAVCAYCNLKRVKIDFIGAYLNTKRPKEVKYKHVWIPADIAEVLIELDPSFKEFLQPDGRILVEMDKLFYGYKEAALYWYLLLIGVLCKHGFVQSYWDRCTLHLFTGEYEVILVICVDDLLAGSTSEEGLTFLIHICEQEFEGGITIQQGDVITHLGMVLDFSQGGEVSITQDKFISDLLEQTKEWKGQLRWASTPMSSTYHEHEFTSQQEYLSDDKRVSYHSITMSVMYLARKSWPQLEYSSGVLSSEVKNPKRYHWNALMRVLAYIHLRRNTHRLVIKPGSLNVLCSADASHMSHADMHGHTGIAIGVEGANGVSDSYFVFISQKQPLLGKSAMECEVIAQDTAAEYAVWSEGIRNDLLPPSILKNLVLKTAAVQGKDNDESKAVYDRHNSIVMQCDNEAAIRVLENGRGTFKRCKHILKRFFWVTELIDAGRVFLKWLCGSDMPADLLTKPVTVEVHDHLLPKLVGLPRANPNL